MAGLYGLGLSGAAMPEFLSDMLTADFAIAYLIVIADHIGCQDCC